MPHADACRSCGSPLLQPLRWEADGRVALRCPECESCFRVQLDAAGLQALERRQAVARAALVDAYERLVSAVP